MKSSLILRGDEEEGVEQEAEKLTKVRRVRSRGRAQMIRSIWLGRIATGS